MKSTNTAVFEHEGRALLPASEPVAETDARQRLGEPLDITRAARLIGCSAWTVRQRLMPNGLPHFRTGRSGKLIFYRDQIIRWVERRQRAEGGIP